jgi:amino acid transporter
MVVPMDEIFANSTLMLSMMAEKLGGEPFKIILSIDAFAVLCGSVLTSIVGVTGLMVRLSKDGVIPDFLSRENSNGAPYWSIILFVSIMLSLFQAVFDPTNPTEISGFGGVYAIAFLSVLTCLSIGAILLKLYRPRIARLVISKWWEIFFSLGAVLAGLVGNIVLTPQGFFLFLAYVAGLLLVVWYMACRVEFLSFGIWMVRNK